MSGIEPTSGRKSAARATERARIAAQIFARLYSPGTGRTAEYFAAQALDAAEAFLRVATAYVSQPSSTKE